MLYLIQIMGLDYSPENVTVNGIKVHDDTFRFNHSKNMLTLKYPINLNHNWVINFN